MLYCYIYFIFFFSSRRRHTRYWRDWSSDVCSSDLGETLGVLYVSSLNRGKITETKQLAERVAKHIGLALANLSLRDTLNNQRSEERRVGKERRSRRSPYH